VSYHSLVALPETLQRLYAYLDVPYFDGKERFCEGSYQTLFGNSAARIHLFDPNTDRYEEYGTELQSIDEAYENETENED
jgi:hypothetical protein